MPVTLSFKYVAKSGTITQTEFLFVPVTIFWNSAIIQTWQNAESREAFEVEVS